MAKAGYNLKNFSCQGGTDYACPNTANFFTINGEDKQRRCSVCFAHWLVDLVTHNDSISFHSSDIVNKIQTVEVV